MVWDRSWEEHNEEDGFDASGHDALCFPIKAGSDVESIKVDKGRTLKPQILYRHTSYRVCAHL
jgi:hypothetical protein